MSEEDPSIDRTLDQLRTQGQLDDFAAGSSIRPQQGRRASSDPAMTLATLPSIEVGGLHAKTTETPDLVARGTIGTGGMGVIHLAWQRSLRREVAVKALPSDAPSERAAHALLQEALFSGTLEHPNIVPVHAVGQDPDGQPLMVMKKIDGVPWLDLIQDPDHPRWAHVQEDRLDWHVALTSKLCDAVQYAHSRGVLHRDIKPENVMVGRFGEVYLLDWGVAVRRADAPELQAIAGTPAYMAPEMLQPSQIDEHTDVYLLAASLYHAVEGVSPHGEGEAPAVFTSVALGRPPPLSDAVPEELQTILHRAMARRPGERFANASELKAALDDFQRHRASIELTAAATRHLTTLERLVADRAGPVDVNAAFHACRFGFQQAQEGWPDNDRAQDGLERALAAMTRFEIAQRNGAAARARLTEMRAPPSELEEDLTRLERELETERSERKRLHRLQRELDPEVSRRQRAIGTLAITVVMAAITSVTLTAHVTELVVVGRRVLLGTAAPLAVGIALVLVVKRRVFFRNRINRGMGYTILVLIAAIIGHRAQAVMRDLPLGGMLAGDMLLVAVVAALSAIHFRKLWLVPAALFAAGGAAATLWPAHALIFSITAILFTCATVIATTLRDLRRPSARRSAATAEASPH